MNPGGVVCVARIVLRMNGDNILAGAAVADIRENLEEELYELRSYSRATSCPLKHFFFSSTQT